MSQQYDKTNRGSLGKNDNRERDTQPEFTGSINIEGVDYWLNAWVKTSSKDGRKFFSLSVKPKEQQQPRQQKQAGPAPSADFEDFNDDIPFASASHDITGNRLQRRLKRGRA